MWKWKRMTFIESSREDNFLWSINEREVQILLRWTKRKGSNACSINQSYARLKQFIIKWLQRKRKGFPESDRT